MKKVFTLLTKTLLVAVCLLGGASSAWADATETIFVNSSKNWEGASLFSVSVASGSMQSGYCKWTKDHAMTIGNTSAKTITAITITYTEQGYSPSNSSKTYSNQMSVTTGTLTAKATNTTTTWSGSTSATSFVISWSNDGWDLRVASVAITYDDGKAASTFALTSAAEVETAIDATSQITYENNAGTVTYLSSDESIATVSSTGLITAIAGGKTTISVTDPGSAGVSGAIKTVTVLVPYANPAAEDSYVLNQDTYSFSNTNNTKYYFNNGFTISVSSGASFDNGGLTKSKKYSHARQYTIKTPSNVTVTFAVITARNNYKNENSNPAANWGNVFGTDYSSEGDLPWSNEDPAEKDFVVASPSAGAELAFQPGGNQWQAIINLYTITYGAKRTVSFDKGAGTGSMDAQTHRAYTTFTLPSSTFTPPTDKGFEGWLCSVDGLVYDAGAEYTMTDANTTFTAQYGSVEGKTIIRVTLGGGTKATVSGAIGGTADVNTQSDKKFGSNSYAGFTLAGENTIKKGDIINVRITTASSGANTYINFYDTKTGTNILQETGTAGEVGDNKFVAGDALNGLQTIYVCRTSSNAWNAYVDYIEVTRPVSINPAKEYTTLTSAYALDFTSVSSDLKAYIATEVSGGSVQMTQVNKVPANTGLVLKATTPGSAVNVPVFDGTGAEDVSANKMAGSATETTAVAEGAGYILKEGVFQPALAGTLPAGKAYLKIDVAAPILNLGFDDATSIESIAKSQEQTANGQYYNLNGQRVAQPTKGLYIVNGKKYVIK